VYESFYGLREAPFAITPDPRFLFHTRNHRDALAYLHYGIDQRKGILALTGEVGVGKTLVIRTLLGQLPRSVRTSIVMNARLSFRQLLYMALLDFDLQPPGRSRVDLLMTLQEFLIRLRQANENAVLIIDEAQNLSEKSLEEFRLLSNLETADAKLLQIVLVGQTELKDKLNRHGLRQLRQRIPGIFDLSRLPDSAVEEYVDFRLQVASTGAAAGLFDADALEEICRSSAGIPRLINQLCDRALLIGFAKGRDQIDGDIVHEAARELGYLDDGAAHYSSVYREA